MPVCLSAVLVLLAPPVWAVDCTPNDITLASQAEVDEFQADHGPGCDRVVGTLVISGPDIVNLDGLSGLTTLWWLEISNNPVLVDTGGLSSVTQTSGPMEIRSNAMLTNLSGLSGVTDLTAGALILESNPNLSDLSALSGLTHIGASLSISNSDALVDLDALSGLNSVASNINISNNDALQSVSGLSGLTDFTATLDFRFNPQLANLPTISGLSQLSGLILYYNASLTDVDELAGLTAVGNQYSDLWIRNNVSLTNLDGLADLISLDAGLEISGNDSLDSCSALAALLDDVDDGAPGPGPGDAGIPDVNGDVIIGPNLPGCDSLEDIVGAEPPPAAGTLTYYGGLETGAQQLLFKGHSISRSCFDSAVPVPSEDDVLIGQLLRACAQTPYQDTDTLVYDVVERRCRLFTDFETSTRLDTYAVYLDYIQPGASLKTTTDVVFKYDEHALLRFDPLSGELGQSGSLLCAESGETPPPPPPDVLGQLAFLKAHNAGQDYNFGDQVAVSGDTAVIAAKKEDGSSTDVNGPDDDLAPDAGTVYVFVRDANGNWVQQAYLKASNAGAGDWFGSDVAIDGDTVVVGADHEDGAGSTSGAVYVFVRSGETWTEQALLRPSDAAGGDWFGSDVAISGDTIAVGAFNESQAFVFTRNAGVWTEQQILTASNAESGDSFGRDITIDGDTIVVGAFGEDSSATGVNGDETDNSASGSGAAYVFVREAGVWTQQAYLKASNTDAGDQFGGRLSLSGDTLAVGAYHERSNATGVDGDQSNNGLEDAGAAYIFVRNGSNWSQQAYVKASNTGLRDGFGSDLSLSGATLAVAAYGEDGNGVDGEDNNASPGSGAVYVFTRDETDTWSQLAYLKASNVDADDWFGRDVGLSGKTLVVGAFYEDSAPGAGESDNSNTDSGAGYVFNISDKVPDPGDDFIPPEVTAPPDLTGVEATGPLTPVALGDAMVTDNSGESLTAVPDFTGPFHLGETIVTWSAQDSSGNIGTDTQLVEVVDTTAPLITAPDDVMRAANGIGSIVHLGTPEISDNAGTLQSLVNDAPESFPLGVTVVTWTATDASGNSASDTQNVTITPPEIVAQSYAFTPVRVDGDMDYGEWGDFFSFGFEDGYLAFKNDKDRLYVLVDVLQDGVDDPLASGGGDRIAFYFDIDEDGAITPGVDLRYVLASGTGNLQLELRCDGCPEGFDPPVARTFSSRAEGFGCFLDDDSFRVIPLRCNNHKVWELAFDIPELGMREDKTVRFGFEVVSGAPALARQFPPDLDQAGDYIYLTLSTSRDLRLKEDVGPGELMPEFEVTQAIQTPANSVDLVAGKRTAVRVWEQSYEDVKTFVFASRDGIDLPGSPLLKVGRIRGLPPGGRGGIADNAFRVLPDSWSEAGTAAFDIVVQGLDDSIAAEVSGDVDFVPTRKPVFWTVPLRTNYPDDVSEEPDVSLITLAEETLQRVAPIGEIQFVRKPIHDTYNPATYEALIEQLRDYDQMTFLAWFLGLAINGEPPFDLPEQVTGFRKRGFTVGDDTVVGSSDPVGLGGDGRVTWVQPTDAEDSMLYAHELNHNLDQLVPWTWGRHVAGCGAGGSDPNWPYGSIHIQETGVYPTGQWFASVEDSTPDFMTYCGVSSTPRQWFSPYRWQAWVDEFATALPSAVQSSKRSAARLNAAETLPATVDSFYISGRVYLDGNGELTQILRQPGVADAEGTTGDYAVRVKDCGDATLAENTFSASFTGAEGESLAYISFSFILAAPPSSCSIQLLYDGELLDERVISPNPPSVQVTLPNGGETWQDDETIAWTANDQDGDPLLFTVLYSGDAGSTWRVLGTRIESTELTVDARDLDGTDSALIRVLASDGANTGSDESDAVFAVAYKGPILEILTPRHGGEFNTSQTILLTGRARMPSGEPWPEQDLLWSTTGGIAGAGPAVDIQLDEGLHPISMIAMEGQTIVAVKTIEILVSDEPGEISFSRLVYSTDEAAGEVSIGVTRSGAAEGSASVLYSTADGSAVSGGDPGQGQDDYLAIPEDPLNRLEWGDGETGTRYFTVTINPDGVSESTETFQVLLAPENDEILGIDTAEIQIRSESSEVLFSDGFE